MDLVHSRAVRKPLVAIILSILKCMFYSRPISSAYRTWTSRVGHGPLATPLYSPLPMYCLYLTEQVRDTEREATIRRPVDATADRSAEQGLVGRSLGPSGITEDHTARSDSDRMTSGEDSAS